MLKSGCPQGCCQKAAKEEKMLIMQLRILPTVGVRPLDAMKGHQKVTRWFGELGLSISPSASGRLEVRDLWVGDEARPEDLGPLAASGRRRPPWNVWPRRLDLAAPRGHALGGSLKPR